VGFVIWVDGRCAVRVCRRDEIENVLNGIIDVLRSADIRRSQMCGVDGFFEYLPVRNVRRFCRR